jgi:hypothetical protein
MAHNWEQMIDELRESKYQVEFDAGLSDDEILQTENHYCFKFPTDLREFLQTALPRGDAFPDWRSSDDEAILYDWLDMPRQGIVFDIEHNGFWMEEWGALPRSLEEAIQTAGKLIASAPRLIPIYMHRMMPDKPQSVGNPVFSVHQTDIIYYGFDLADYLRHEFALPGREPWPENVRPIEFWDIERLQEVRWGDGPLTFKQ